jgi:hypothetical protein
MRFLPKLPRVSTKKVFETIPHTHCGAHGTAGNIAFGQALPKDSPNSWVSTSLHFPRLGGRMGSTAVRDALLQPRGQ